MKSSQKSSAAQAVIQDVAANLGVAEAKVLLRWGVQHGYSVLTKSSKPERIKDNLHILILRFQLMICSGSIN